MSLRAGAAPDSEAARQRHGARALARALALRLASELSRCPAGGDRPGALPGTPGHTRGSLTLPDSVSLAQRFECP